MSNAGRLRGAVCVGLVAAMITLSCGAAVATSQTFVAFFDDDAADLTARSVAVIQAFVTVGRRIDYECARVVGHSDRTGTRERRQLIARLRAEAVARELAQLGVPEACIILQACGDSSILVPTEDGVPEPQNRRVDIIHRRQNDGPGAGFWAFQNCPWTMLPGVATPTSPPR